MERLDDDAIDHVAEGALGTNVVHPGATRNRHNVESEGVIGTGGFSEVHKVRIMSVG